MRSIAEKTGIQLKITARSQIIAALVTGALAVFIAMHVTAFFEEDIIMGKVQLFLSCLGALGAGALVLFVPETVNKRGEKLQRRISAVLFVLLPVLSLCMIEFLHGTFIYNWSPRTFIQNYIFMLICYLLAYAVSGSLRLPAAVCSILGYIFGIVNHFVNAFRGTPFLPGDISSAKTGLSVAATFDFTPDNQVVLSTVLLVFLLALAWRMRAKGCNRYVTRAVRVIGVALAVIFCVLLFRTDWFAENGMKPDFFNQARGYTNRGSLFQFVINTKYLHVEAPEDYSADEAEEIVKDAIDEEEFVPPLEGEKLPNIICVMNETFSDLTILGDRVEINQDPMPFIRGIEENAVKGYVHVPVYGAGTANSEFEFLTGDSIAFLPMGACAYESYVKMPYPSLVYALDALGYDKTAFHPYYGDNWDRNLVYPYLGFDRFMDISTILGEDIVEKYREDRNFEAYYQAVKERYPNDTVFMRRYVSDAFDYQKVIERYESDRDGAPFFMFNVTMQNHSGYLFQGNFQEDVYLTGAMEGKYPKVDQYLSLIKRADEALEELFAYFAAVDEPTVICVFGDHQPSVEQEFYEEVFGKPLSELTVEEKSMMYQTPFVIWANYDIEEETVEAISANFLGALMMKTAGLPKTTYQEYLLNLHETLPVINPIGYRDAQGHWYALDDEDAPYADLLEDYRKVQYNHLFDRKNRLDRVFLLDQEAFQKKISALA